ncbi:hypothetical protein XO10_00340 [Marinitoga sp. 1135]|uniref:FecR domain-containing protein n=1 Tax=unclassified Marinitoga TaxID=2640159 RepID=UPI00095066D0|nr:MULTISPECIES: FecR domain-containing protein [unclassified Marinitoga]APT75017.1 hypothetical protein LN42_00340 [Marinitoga sp. 1137]NUU94773.1 hypothetical protein [Marinitoga sp. 1135]
MFKKWGVFLLFMLLSITFFSEITVTTETQTIYVGESVNITVSVNDSAVTHLYVDVTNGGFDDPFILFDGFDLVDGTANLVFLAPLMPGKAELVFYNEDKTLEKKIEFDILEEKIEMPETSLIILEKEGNVLYKEADSDVWDSINSDTVIKENSELLTLKDGYIHLKEPELNIEIKVSPETQLYIKKLRASESGDIDIEYELKKGATVNKINEILAPGSKYLVGSGSVVAGVRGTEFGFEKKGNNTNIRTFEGTVYTMVNNKLFPVKAGNMFNYSPQNPNPQLEKLDMPIEDYEKNLMPEKKQEEQKPETKVEEKKEEKVAEEKRETPVAEEPAAAPVKTKANLGNISFGKQTKGNSTYLVYSFAPNFDIGPFGIGIGFNAYQESIDGPLYYGIPSKEATSQDLWSAISINYLKLDFPMFYIRYGVSPSYTKGLGLFMNNYSIPYSRVFDTELRFGGLKLGMHIPYEVTSLMPFNYQKTSNLMFGYVDMDLGLFNTEITGIYNMSEEDLKDNELKQAILATLYKKIFFIKFGVETDVVYSGDDTLTYGLLIGPMIDFPPYFQFMFGFDYLSDGFNMEYVGPYYEYNVANGKYMDLNQEKSMGLIGKSYLTIAPYLNITLDYNRPFSNARDGLLKGNMTVKIPALGGLPELTAGFSYIQWKFLEDDTVDSIFLNKNTWVQGFIYYPVLENSGIIYSISYDVEKDEFEYTINFETIEF